MEKRDFQLNDEYVRLCDLLKLTGLAPSGALGKQMVAEGRVSVDGRVESRKTAKIRAGQSVQCGDVRLNVVAK